jgi:hypothetical protein
MYDVKTIEYTKRKPSRKMILRDICKAAERGYGAFDIIWGENALEIVWHPNHVRFYGIGWIKDISGSDIANEMNVLRNFQTVQLQHEKHIYQFHKV